MKDQGIEIPVGTKALILSKLYYGVISKSLESLDVERYFSVLYFLSANNGCSQQFICNHLAVDKTAMVKVMNYLIKAEYIERQVNPKDRREHFITLTQKGLKQTEQVVKAFDLLDNDMFANIKKEEKEIFTKVLQNLCDNLLKMPANDLFFNYKKTSGK
jgi:DNA-binding MarR family transcriptional regulator